LAGLAAIALLVAACSSGGASPVPVTPAAASTNVGAPSTPAAPAPPAPSNFTATRKGGSVPCPSADGSCSQTDFAWQAGADPGAGFRVYSAATGEDPDATCLTAQAGATVRLGAKPAARTAQALDPMATGGGQICYWITAVNSTGESAMVPAASNAASSPAPTVAAAASQMAPVRPTNFTATRKSGSVSCLGADGVCSETDLAWQSTAGAATWFRVYVASIGLDPNATCLDVQDQAKAVLDTKPGATSAQFFEPIATGTGSCLWLTAVNDAGESGPVPAGGE
jgi:hypothetical protein